MTHRTRVKICGLTRIEDVQAAVAAGVDALGFVFYAKSPRYVDPVLAARLIAAIPPFVSTVGLFVNASADEIASVVAIAPVSLLQFHGDETPQQCAQAAQRVNRRYIRAVRISHQSTGANLLEYEQIHQATGSHFTGLLLDAFVDGYGGGGKVFDWSLIPEELAPRVVLSGGLSVQNATDAVRQVRPYAVDVSSGVELDKGIKDAVAMRAFIDAVRHADLASSQPLKSKELS